MTYRRVPGDSDGKESACQCWRPGFDPWVGRIPRRRKWQPTPIFFPRETHGQGSLVGYSPWDCKESDTTEQLHFHIKWPIGLFLETTSQEGPKDRNNYRDIEHSDYTKGGVYFFFFSIERHWPLIEKDQLKALLKKLTYFFSLWKI